MTVAPAKGHEDLKDVINAYNELAERLQSSQRALQKEVARLREQLAEKNRQLATKNRLEVLGEMAAGVAHEIRNPLGGIELYAGLIAREASGDDKVMKYTGKIQSATRHMSKTVGEILDFTRPIRPQMKTIPLAEIISASIDLASSALQKSAVELSLDVPATSAALKGDFNILQRAFLNVILNATDVMSGGGTLGISAAKDSIGSHPAWRLSFADSGPGIDAGDISKVFDPFFTRKEGGTGLGLAMVGRIVEAHGGRVSAGNREGSGAVFTFVLPAAKERKGRG